MTDDEARELIKGYLASVSYSDAQVGRILAALEKSGEADNTIVILWGDHGYHLTEHGLWRKNTIYHVANRIPLLIHAPGKSPGVCARLVESIDLYPTLLALTGVAADGLRLDGRSLIPLLEKPDAEWPHPAFIHANKTTAWSRTNTATPSPTTAPKNSSTSTPTRTSGTTSPPIPPTPPG
ncbi:MAG: sulfatase-like hydrolase/transferase [Verrucomicrobiae bacterium]|nr:sulfatase-like hydrolase/transferase [Verrucomicrobiae bacterium]